MGVIKNLFPGGNTRYGFYSFFDYMASPAVKRKIVLKGGPGTGKSTFMKKMGEAFASQDLDVEYHWCSSDNNSLDGLVIGQQEICIVDGTAPHLVDPGAPGAIDEIINLGDFWTRENFQSHRDIIVDLGYKISRCFSRAHSRLKEAGVAYEEWQSYYAECQDFVAVNRNVLAMAEDLLHNCPVSLQKPRHLFAGAISPEGPVAYVISIIPDNYTLYGVKGHPGSGLDKQLAYTAQLAEMRSVFAEIYHNPFDPQKIDIIVLPGLKTAMLDMSATLIDYAGYLHHSKYKRLLDFEQFTDKLRLDGYTPAIDSARERFNSGIEAAVEWLKDAKAYHDELESYYVMAMDFDAINQMQENLFEELIKIL